MNLLKYLFHRATWEKLPPIPREYSTEYDLDEVDRDTAVMMSLTHTRCPQGVRMLERKHSKTAHQLIYELPRRRRPRRVLSRLANLYRRAMGITAYDPMKALYRQHMRRDR
jgi:hypothetical protein